MSIRPKLGSEVSRTDHKSMKRPTRVLLVAMLDSVHTARWLNQFKDSHIDFILFPSQRFRSLHPLIQELCNGESLASYRLSFFLQFEYLEELLDRFLSKFLSPMNRGSRLLRLIHKTSPDFLHALEFQRAGYLCNAVLRKHHGRLPFIATNWGSDIVHYMKFPDHEKSIRDLLGNADFYSAECRRDYALASQLGFKGTFLPQLPNSGGFDLKTWNKSDNRTSTRKVILVKGYGGYFGRVDLVLQIAKKILNDFVDFRFFFYSVTEDVQSSLVSLSHMFPGRVEWRLHQNSLTHSEMKDKFLSARVYIGCSMSDGISTSFLEALVSGAYPIQSRTSCADEWVEKGAIASLVDLDPKSVLRELLLAITDDDLVDYAQSMNRLLAEKELDETYVRALSRRFYSLPLN